MPHLAPGVMSFPGSNGIVVVAVSGNLTINLCNFRCWWWPNFQLWGAGERSLETWNQWAPEDVLVSFFKKLHQVSCCFANSLCWCSLLVVEAEKKKKALGHNCVYFGLCPVKDGMMVFGTFSRCFNHFMYTAQEQQMGRQVNKTCQKAVKS